MQVGQVVISLSGHDKGEYFIVTKVDKEYLFLADGKTRQIDRPKKKKEKHVQKTNYIAKDIQEKIENALGVSNADLREAVENYKNNNQGGDDLGK